MIYLCIYVNTTLMKRKLVRIYEMNTQVMDTSIKYFLSCWNNIKLKTSIFFKTNTFQIIYSVKKMFLC